MKFKLFSGTANPKVAEDIANYLDRPLSKITVNRFSDGEINVQIGESIRGVDCFIIQPTCAPANDNLMELLIITDAMRRASAKSITAIVPYFGYARQDRKAAPRVPISAKLVANMMEKAGIDRVVTIDLHAGQIQGFFDIPVDNLYGSILFFEYFKEKNDLLLQGFSNLSGIDTGSITAIKFNSNDNSINFNVKVTMPNANNELSTTKHTYKIIGANFDKIVNHNPNVFLQNHKLPME